MPFIDIYNDPRYKSLTLEQKAIVIKRLFDKEIGTDPRYANLNEAQRAIVQKRFYDREIAPIEKSQININFDSILPTQPTDMTGVDMTTGYSETSVRQSNIAKAEKRISELQNSLMRSNDIARKNINKEIVHWQNVIAYNEDGLKPDERAAFEGARQSWMGKTPLGRGVSSVGIGAIDLASSLATVFTPDTQFARITKAASEGIQEDAGTIEKSIDSVLMSMPMTVAVGLNPLLGMASIETAIVKGNLQTLSDKYGSLEKAGGRKIANAVIKGTIESGIEVASDLMQLKLLRTSLKSMPKGKATQKIAKMLSDKMTAKGFAKDILKSGLTEGSEEVIQNFSNRIYDSISGEEPFPTLADFTKESITGFAGGLMGGLMFGAYLGGGARIKDNSAWKKVKGNTDEVSKALVDARESIIKGDIETARTLIAPIQEQALKHKDAEIRLAGANVIDALLYKDNITGKPEEAKMLAKAIADSSPFDYAETTEQAVIKAIADEQALEQGEQAEEVLEPAIVPQADTPVSSQDQLSTSSGSSPETVTEQDYSLPAPSLSGVGEQVAEPVIAEKTITQKSQSEDWSVPQDSDKRKELIDLYKMMMETKRQNKSNIPQEWKRRLSLLVAAENEIEILPNEVTSEIVYGHPQGIQALDKDHQMLIPIKVSSKSDLSARIKQVIKLRDALGKKLGEADAIANNKINATPIQKKRAKEYLSSVKQTEDKEAHDLLNSETLPELYRLEQVIEKLKQQEVSDAEGTAEKDTKPVSEKGKVKQESQRDSIRNPEQDGKTAQEKIKLPETIDETERAIKFEEYEYNTLKKAIDDSPIESESDFNKRISEMRYDESKEKAIALRDYTIKNRPYYMSQLESKGKRITELKEHLNKLKSKQTTPEKVEPREVRNWKREIDLLDTKIAKAEKELAQDPKSAVLKQEVQDLKDEKADRQRQIDNVKYSTTIYPPLTNARNQKSQLKVTELEDNYLKDLSEYSDEMYREMSPEEARYYMSDTFADMRRIWYFSNNADLALGQGGSKGIIVRVKTNGLQGQIDRSKPSWEISLKQGNAEYIAKYNDGNQYKENLVSITILPNVGMDKGSLSILLHTLNKDNRFVKVKNDDGSVTYYKNSVKHSTATTAKKGNKTIQEFTKGFISVIRSKVRETDIDPETNSAMVYLKNGDVIRLNAVSGAIEVKYNGKTEFVNDGNLVAIVDMAMDVGDTDIVAFHEGGHVAFRMFLSEAERNLLLEKYGTEEQAILAFQEYVRTRNTQGLSAKIVQTFKDLWTRLRVAISRMMGREYAKTWEDVFASMRLGVFAMPQNQMSIEQAKYMLEQAWHGSGAFFDRFDVQFIGTGEGAQAFGWGIYVTERKGVARDYADKLGNKLSSGDEYIVMLPDGTNTTNLNEISNWIYERIKIPSKFSFEVDRFARMLLLDGLSETITKVEKELKTYSGNKYLPNDIIDTIHKYDKQILDLIGKELSTKKNISHNIYSTTVWENRQEDVLEWDKNVSQDQIRKVTAQAKKEDLNIRYKNGYLYYDIKKHGVENYSKPSSGERLYHIIQEAIGTPKEASLFLLRAGIDGIKYPVQAMSGGKGEKGYNYVVFNADEIKIKAVERYSQIMDNPDIRYSQVQDGTKKNITEERKKAMAEGKAKAQKQGEAIYDDVHQRMLDSIDSANTYRKVSKQITDALALISSGKLTEQEKKENLDKIRDGVRRYADIALRSGIPASVKIGKVTYSKQQVKQILNAALRIRSIKSLQFNLIKIAKIADEVNRKHIRDEIIKKLNKGLSSQAVDNDAKVLLKYIKTISEMSQSDIDKTIDALQTHEADEESKNILDRMTSDARIELVSLFSNLNGKSPERLAAAYGNLVQIIKTGRSIYDEMQDIITDKYKRMINIMYLIAPKQARAFTKNELNYALTGIDAKSKRGGMDKALGLTNYRSLIFFDSLMRDLDRSLFTNRKYIKEHYDRLVERHKEETDEAKKAELAKDISTLEEVMPNIEKWNGTNGFFYNEIFINRIQPAYQKKARLMAEKHSLIYSKLTDIFKEHFGKSYGKQWTSALIASVTSEKPAVVNAWLKKLGLPPVSQRLYKIDVRPMDRQGNESSQTVTINLQQMANLYAYSRNPKLEETLLKMGFNQDAMKQVTEALNGDKFGMVLKDFVTWTMDIFYPQFYHEINDVYRDVTGYDLGKEEIYSPLARMVKRAERQAEINAPKIYGRNTDVTSSHHTERTDNTEPISLDGSFLNEVFSHVNTEVHYIAMAKAVQDIKRTLLNKDVLNSIEVVQGRGKRKAILSFMDDMASGAYGQLQKDNAMTTLANNLTFAALAINMSLPLKQFSSLPLFFMEFVRHPHMIVPSMLYSISHAKETYKIFKSSPVIHQRYTEGITFDYIMTISGKLGMTKTLKQFHNQWIAPGVWGDKASVFFGGGAYFWYRYHLYEKTMSKEEAKAKALSDLELMTERTQQGQSPYFVNHLQRATTIGHYAMRFQTQPGAMFNILRDAVLDASVNPKALPDFFWKLSMILLSQIIFGYVASGFAKRNDIWDWLYDTLLGLGNSFPIWGNIYQTALNSAVTGQFNKAQAGNLMVGSDVPFEAVQSVANANKMVKAMRDNEMDAVKKNAFEILKSLSPLTGVPMRGIVNDVTGIYDYSTGEDKRIGRLLGMSEAWLDRQGSLYRDKIGNRKMEFNIDDFKEEQ